MQAADLNQLFVAVKTALAGQPSALFAIVGHTPVAYDLLAYFNSIAAMDRVAGIYSEEIPSGVPGRLRPLQALASDCPTHLIVASDEGKESLLEAAAPLVSPSTRVLLAGYSHFQFKDPAFESVVSGTLVQSLANGYPHTLTHLYQCLQNAARRSAEGVVVEFGCFKGGTTMLLAKFVKQLGRDWRVIGFDSFDGFPPRRSVLDMYDHPDCVFRDEAAVREYLKGENVEIIAGDIVQTAVHVRDEKIVLAFMDTDNYTSAMAALDAIQDRVVPGGAIVFDHFTGRNRFLLTLGERIAGKRLLRDPRYFNLHDTGVFLRQG